MYIKLTGVAFLVVACGITGITMSNEYIKRLRELKVINKMLLLLKGEIKYNNSGINEALKKVANMSEKISQNFLNNVCELFDNGKIPLRESWNGAIDNYLLKKSSLKKEDYLIIRDIGINLGITDRETQLNNLDSNMLVIEQLINGLEAQREQKCKLYRTMGFMAGAFVAIIII